MNELLKLYRKCRKTDTNFLVAIVFYLWYKMHNKEFFLHQKTTIKGAINIRTNGLLQIGTNDIGFSHKNDVTYLNIRGKLIFSGPFTIARGCRIDIGKDAIVNIGVGGFINPFTKLIIQEKLDIGDYCFISWDCQFLDHDFHKVSYDGKNENLPNEIVIGNNVWIGCGVSVFKGTYISKGSVVAANSVVRGSFKEENVLIDGNPARIIKRNVHWG